MFATKGQADCRCRRPKPNENIANITKLQLCDIFSSRNRCLLGNFCSPEASDCEQHLVSPRADTFKYLPLGSRRVGFGIQSDSLTIFAMLERNNNQRRQITMFIDSSAISATVTKIIFRQREFNTTFDATRAFTSPEGGKSITNPSMRL